MPPVQQKRFYTMGRLKVTKRQIRIVELVVKGLTNEEIAKELFIGLSTVRTHLMFIRNNNGLNGKVQIAVAALDNGPPLISEQTDSTIRTSELSLAVQLAIKAIKMGKYQEALTTLESVKEPSRSFTGTDKIPL